MSLQPSNRVHLVVYPNQLSSSHQIPQNTPDIKSTLQDGTPSTLVKETIGLKGKVLIEIIGA